MSYLENAAHTGGVLTLTNGSHSDKLTLSGSYKISDFSLDSTPTETVVGFA